MKKIILLLIIISTTILFVFFTATPVASEKSSISIKPSVIYPGDPVMVTITASSTVKEIYYDNKIVPGFIYKKKINALIAVPFEEKILKHKISAKLSNGMFLEKDIVLTERVKIVKPLGIPAKLGGNTPQAGKTLVSNLSIENKILSDVTNISKSSKKKLWTESFGLPLKNIFVTDTYGYNRDTVGNSIVHKGTDYRAKEGTDVMSMNDGIVTFAGKFIVYGNTIIVDHGLGLSTMYMHLSKLGVKVGDIVKKGDVIGQSGMTGYAESAHLHLSIRIGGISIEPEKFRSLFDVI
jgi:murein DD-endopeptidase MepM/ murein hydrolase activator NlpD